MPFLLKMFGLCCRHNQLASASRVPPWALLVSSVKWESQTPRAGRNPTARAARWEGGRQDREQAPCPERHMLDRLGLQEKGRAAQEPVTLLPVPVPIFPKVCPWDGSASHPPLAEFLTSHVKSCHGLPWDSLSSQRSVSLCQSGESYVLEDFTAGIGFLVSKKHFLDSESLRI